MPRHPDDEKLLISFFRQMEQNAPRTLEKGKPEYDEFEFIRIIVPGSRDEHVAIVSEDYRARFADEYAEWKKGEGAPITGTPLSEWPLATASFIEQMKIYGARSVEDLANLSEGLAMREPGLMTMRAKAQAWLASFDDNAKFEKVASENDALKARIAELEAMARRKQRAARALEHSDPAIPEEEAIAA